MYIVYTYIQDDLIFMDINSPLPKHYQLSQLLRQQILSGELPPGIKILGENQLCQKYQLSRGTVRKALSTLINEGLIQAKQGYGTYVVDQPWTSRYFFTLNQFNEEMVRHHLQPKTILLERKLIQANLQISEKLQIAHSKPVIYIARLRIANATPVLYEQRYLAQQLCPALMDEDLENQSIHTLLVQKYQIPLVKTIHILEARGLSEKEAELLHAEPGSAAFYVDRLTYTLDSAGEHPAVWYLAVYKGDEYTFRVEHTSEPFPAGMHKSGSIT